MSQDISTLLTNLDRINNLDTKPIFVPSLNKEVSFKLLTAAQHKNILTTIMDQNNSGVTLSLLLNQIIKDTICEKVILNTLDKSYILIALRAFSLSNIYEHNNIKSNLFDVLNNKIPLSLSAIEIKEKNYTICISAPSLEKDSQINRESKRKIDESKSEDNVSKLALDEIYTNEFIKYIDYIEFENDNATIKILFSNLSHAQKRNVVDKLPAVATISMLEKINKLKESSEEFLKIDGSKISVSFDQSFFTV